MSVLLQVNQVIFDTKNEKHWRILWIGKSDENSWWIDLDGNSNVPRTFDATTISDEIGNGIYIISADTWAVKIRDEELTDTEKRYRDKTWTLLQDILKDEPRIYEPSSRVEMLKSLDSGDRDKWKNLYRLLGRYWKLGKVKNALIPQFAKSGADRMVPIGVKFGLPARTNAMGKPLVNRDFENFRAAVRLYRLKEPQHSLKETYSLMLKNFYSYKDDDGTIKLYEKNRLPSPGQFKHWYYQNRDITTEKKIEVGERTYELKYRAVMGTSDGKLLGPGMIAQIDATIADVFLVRTDDRNAIVGRPTLYFMKDVASRMVIGMHVTLAPPSSSAALMTVLNAVEDKVEYCKKFGIDISPEEWPCRLLPDEIVGDRGELESKLVDCLTNNLGISITNMPPFRGDLKGIIEQTFRTIQMRLTSFVPGRVTKDYGQRCTEDPRFAARLDIKQFTAIIIRCVLEYNNFHRITTFNVMPEMLRDKVNAIPLELWNYGLLTKSGGHRPIDVNWVKYCIFPTEVAKVTESGIRFHGLFYTCDKAEKEKWYENARITHVRDVNVVCDPRDVSTIYLFTGREKEVLECHLVDHFSCYNGWQLQEIMAKHEAELDAQRACERAEYEARSNTDAFFEKTYADAEKMHAASPKPISKARQISEIRENRAAELNEVERDGKAGERVEPATSMCNEGSEGKTVSFMEHLIHNMIEEEDTLNGDTYRC